MDKRRMENSPTDQEVPGTPDIRVKRKKTTKLLAGNDKIMKNKEESIKNQRINDENLSDNINKNILEDLNNLDGLMFDEDDFFDQMPQQNTLDLTTLKRCIVDSVEVDKKSHDLILNLHDDKDKASGVCRLKVPWCYSKVQEKDVVSVEGVWDENLNCYKVTSDSGKIVINPDYLISGTSVVGSLFCQRKGVLTERFRGIDSDSKIMNIGTLVHEMLQTILRKRVTTIEGIQQVCDDIIKSPQTVYSLYSCKMSEAEIRKEIDPFVPKLFNFVQRYVMGDYNIPIEHQNPNNKPFAGQIDEIQDIEENIWSPRLGLKGKIDVTVKVHDRNNFFNSNVRVMPLELKTGKSSFALEHKGQLILYQMMMTDMGKKVNSGLLLYLRDLIMSEVVGNKHEQRDLIMLRNQLAYYLRKDLLDDLGPNLPEPISHHSACGKCPYNILCCTFLRFGKNIEISESNPLNELSPLILSHLEDIHFDYFLHWTRLVTLENNEAQKQNQIKLLWTKSPEQRFKRGSCLINLEISGHVLNEDDEEFIHTFVPQMKIDLTLTNFDVGDYLIVSTNSRVSVAAGRVISLTSEELKMSLERDLNSIFPNQIFHLDKYESQSQMIFNLTNLGVLLDPTESSEKLRKIIIAKNLPTIINSLPSIVAKQGEHILLKLNPVQRKAVLHALTSQDYMLLKGLPGTGKTQTLVALIQLLILMKKRILITSHTHSAIDNILVRLNDRKIKFLRLGSTSRIHPSLREFSEHQLTMNCRTPEELAAVYSEHKIVAVTCLGSAHPLIAQTKFDVCLVDEATQIFQPSIIRPLYSSQKFILVGDPEQLPPLVRSNEAKILGADESLFKRLDSDKATKILNLQYRMNKTITKLANSLTYQGDLKCANDIVEKAVMKLPKPEILSSKYSKEKWLVRTLSAHLDMSCVLLNTGNVFKLVQEFSKNLKVEMSQRHNDDEEQENSETRSIYKNYCEVAAVLHLVKVLIESGIKGNSIGIIAPYRAQVDAFKHYMNLCGENQDLKEILEVEVNTVDQYQGRDKELIIYSCTYGRFPEAVNDQNSNSGEILEDRRRLTVAITRAKHKLIMIGDVDSLSKYLPFKDLFSHMNSMSKILLQDGKQGFSWDQLLKCLP